jgi:hypothetical protein
MKLSADELSWISLQLKKYRTVFPEFYAEVYDHIISAIELKKDEGDDRSVEVIYRQIIEGDFNGYKSIQKNAVQHFFTSPKGLWDVFMAIMRRNRNINLPFGLVVVFIICFLPLQRKLLNEIMAGISLVLAIFPIIYCNYLLGFKTLFSNKEIKITTTRTFAGYAIHMFNLLYIIIFSGIRLFVDKDFKPFNCHPIVAAVLMMFVLAYDICFVQFYNQEFKKNIAV